VAARLGVFRSVGEAVLAHIDADEILEKKLNGRLLTFQEVGKYHDPVYAGICFFRIMVLEGLHQRAADHLWLHYMPFFARRLSVVLIEAGWYAIVAALLSAPQSRRAYLRYKKWVDRSAGVIMGALGIRLATTATAQ
jgi:hypothetical protein